MHALWHTGMKMLTLLGNLWGLVENLIRQSRRQNRSSSQVDTKDS